MNDKTRMRFTRMLTAYDHNNRLIKVFLLFWISNFKQRQVNATIAFPNAWKLDKLKWRCFCNCFNLVDVRLHLCVRVWNCVCNIHFVTFKVKFKIEAHTIIGFWFMRIHFIDFSMIRWYIVIHIETSVKPTLSSFYIIFSWI